MPNILDEIFAAKQVEVAESKRARPLRAVRAEAETAPGAASFASALRRGGPEATIPALIAEVKFASPSKGILVEAADPLGLAGQYVQAGAAAVSVLTDQKYFHGRLDDLKDIHKAFPAVPLLRKDFVCDPYQVYEARAAGASAILLIAAHLESGLLADLHALARELGLAVLVEVHDRNELDTAVKVDGLSLLGVNNRDLRTFRVDVQTCLGLRPLVPDSICFVAESGIHSREDVLRLAAARVDAMLIGEALVTAPDVSQAVQALFGRDRLPENG
ncbi:MAG TPA: indole-3-glycerol phosphate synthase TrpC [Anaerolineales bacterium]|nr:indole-3-glycerol phosphate synthase TrpC [Anaerolineales bacterium]